jgi:hypothetical protein
MAVEDEGKSVADDASGPNHHGCFVCVSPLMR